MVELPTNLPPASTKIQALNIMAHDNTHKKYRLQHQLRLKNGYISRHNKLRERPF